MTGKSGRKPGPQQDEKGRFVKGNNANPAGRPLKKDCIRDMLREEIAGELTLPDGRKITKAKLIAMKAVSLAAQGDLNAIKYLSDQLDGAPKQTVEHSGSIVHAPISPAAARAAAAAAEEAGEI